MKKLVLIAALVSLPSLSYAQGFVEKEYELKLSLAEINIIGEGLSSVPYGKAFPLVNKLREQMFRQQPKPEPPKAVEPAKPSSDEHNGPPSAK